MTAFVSSRQHSQNPLPAPADQPTPQSPPPFMPANHAPSSTMTMDKNQYQQALPNTATPPSSAGSGPRPPIPPVTNSLLTPASSGAANSAHEDMEVDTVTEESFADSNPSKRRRTNGSFDAEYRSIPPSLRRRRSDTDEKIASVPPSRSQIEELISNPDCSPYHLVCEKPHVKSYPDPTDNLLQLYGLKSTVDKVARFDTTGKKNKLRKSYKGHIAGLSGKIEVITRPTQLGQMPMLEPGVDPDEYKLQHLAFFPEEEWRLQNVLGKEMTRSFDMAKLRRGLAGITKGEIPGFDASILGLDDDVSRKRTENARSPPAAIGTPQPHPNGSPPSIAPAVGGANGGEDSRPKRKKRRRYDERSYEGYGEGYDDDDSAANPVNGPGGSSWNGDPKKKKRKKNPDVSSPGMNLGHHEMPVQTNMIYGR